jgi:hypothetical protein
MRFRAKAWFLLVTSSWILQSCNHHAVTSKPDHAKQLITTFLKTNYPIDTLKWGKSLGYDSANAPQLIETKEIREIFPDKYFFEVMISTKKRNEVYRAIAAVDESQEKITFLWNPSDSLAASEAFYKQFENIHFKNKKQEIDFRKEFTDFFSDFYQVMITRTFSRPDCASLITNNPVADTLGHIYFRKNGNDLTQIDFIPVLPKPKIQNTQQPDSSKIQMSFSVTAFAQPLFVMENSEEKKLRTYLEKEYTWENRKEKGGVYFSDESMCRIFQMHNNLEKYYPDYYFFSTNFTTEYYEYVTTNAIVAMKKDGSDKPVVIRDYLFSGEDPSDLEFLKIFKGKIFSNSTEQNDFLDCFCTSFCCLTPITCYEPIDENPPGMFVAMAKRDDFRTFMKISFSFSGDTLKNIAITNP